MSAPILLKKWPGPGGESPAVSNTCAWYVLAARNRDSTRSFDKPPASRVAVLYKRIVASKLLQLTRSREHTGTAINRNLAFIPRIYSPVEWSERQFSDLSAYGLRR